MKIWISPEECDAGITIVMRSAKTVASIRDAIVGNIAIALNPPQGDRCIIIPLELKSLGGSKHELRFMALKVLCFKLCHLRSTNLKSLTIVTNLGQRTFEADSDHATNHRICGPGVDPELIEGYKTEFARLVHDDPSNEIVRRVSRYLFEQVKAGRL